jgi:hypothetical protein
MHHLRSQFFDDDDYLDEFSDFLRTVEWSDRSPLNTEMFFLWSMIRTTKPKLFIESGTFRGYSANLVCEALDRNSNGAEFITYGFDLDGCLKFARKRLARHRFATVVEGDSREMLKGWSPEARSTAFFVDGPKGRNMAPLFFTILAKFPNVQFIAVHDCEKESGSGNRHYLEAFFWGEYLIMYCGSDFQDKFAYLDDSLVGRSELVDWKPYYWDGVRRDSYGTETGYVLPILGKMGTVGSRRLFSLYRSFRFRVYHRLGSVYSRIRRTYRANR